MNNSSVEKLLQEKAELLPKANFNLTSEITYQTAFSIQKDKKTVVRPVLRIAFATLAIVIFTFSICFVASADFRNKVIYVFRANRQEIIPKISSGNSAIKLVGKRNIEDVADVFYYNIGGNSVKDSIITISKFDESKKYYSMEDNVVKEITPSATHISKTVEFNGRNLDLNFEYGTLNGKPYLQNFFNDDPYYFYNEDMIWVRTDSGNRLQNSEYYFLYNVKTGEVTDALLGVVTENARIESIQFSPDKQKMLLAEFNGGYPGSYIYFDAAAKESASLSVLTGIDDIYSCSFADDEVLFIQKYEGKLQANVAADEYRLSGYCYNLSTGKTTTLFKENDTVIYALHGMCILKRDGNCRIVTSVGEEYTVEGIDLGDGYQFLMNPDHTKIAILSFSGKQTSTLGTNEIGVIDLVKKEIKIFEREGYDNNKEVSISWNDVNSLIVATSDNAFYLYRFK